MPPPVTVRETPEARRWIAARSLRLPLVILKFVSPLLTIATLAVIVRQVDLAAQPLDVLFALALPFGLPFLLAGAYPLARWSRQEWTLDRDGIHGRGRVRGDYRWSEVADWRSASADRLPGSLHLVFRPRARRRVHMVVPAEDREAVERWFREGRVADG